MPPQIIECDQGTPEWYRARLGIPTASEFGSILTPGKTKVEAKTRRTYLLKLAGEILLDEPMDVVHSRHLERGKSLEAEARDYYALANDCEPQCVGFIRNGGKGCSPDSLLGADGMLEIKTALPHLLIDRLLRGEFPPEHVAQCQGALWVAEREWIDIAVYWPRLPLFVKRAYRDEPYIAKMEKAVAAFNEELEATVDAIRSYGKAGVESQLRKAMEPA